MEKSSERNWYIESWSTVVQRWESDEPDEEFLPAAVGGSGGDSIKRTRVLEKSKVLKVLKY